VKKFNLILLSVLTLFLISGCANYKVFYPQNFFSLLKYDVLNENRERNISSREFDELDSVISDILIEKEESSVDEVTVKLVNYAKDEILAANSNEKEKEHLRKHGEHSSSYIKRVNYLTSMIKWGEDIIAYKRHNYQIMRDLIKNHVEKTKKDFPKMNSTFNNDN
jgi:hypothetical protein